MPPVEVERNRMPEPRPTNIEDLFAHAGWVRALAYQLVVNRDHVDDVVQQVWAAALERPPTEVARVAWLRRVTRNVAARWNRDEVRRRRREDHWQPPVPPEQS